MLSPIEDDLSTEDALSHHVIEDDRSYKDDHTSCG
jgi:hypothetical protein